VLDRIFVEGIKFHGYHGLTRPEREIGVRLAVDVELWLDLEPSGRSDRVADTLDYRKVHERVIELGHGKSHFLLESFGLQLIDILLAEFPPVRRVTVRVRKETPVLNGIVDSVGVELTRMREQIEP
jgi:dihydroneopterin aldolase